MPSTVKIPVLDCAEISGQLPEIQETQTFRNFARQLGDGMRTVGFAYLINHHDTEPAMVKKKSPPALRNLEENYYISKTNP